MTTRRVPATRVGAGSTGSRGGHAPRLLVVGLGNDDRGDDGAGLEAARRLAPLLAGRAEVRAHPGEPVDLIGRWGDAELLVLIDAARTGRTAGTLHRFEPGKPGLPDGRLGPSSHAFDLLVALRLSDALGTSPGRTVIHAIEGEHFTFGATRSSAVERALPLLVDRVLAEVRRALAGAPAD
ncbi:MAG: hydrogenase maturation protease [Trueperaceae bacterium]|nr:hydrogenase maturation protease [Trueperaceae bacterium]